MNRMTVELDRRTWPRTMVGKDSDRNSKGGAMLINYTAEWHCIAPLQNLIEEKAPSEDCEWTPKVKWYDIGKDMYVFISQKQR